jgi:hypothetical protein
MKDRELLYYMNEYKPLKNSALHSKQVRYRLVSEVWRQSTSDILLESLNE